MELGNFSLSLSVKDLGTSQAFYEKLGFAVIGGDAAQGWLILKSPSCVIGLFQGMFERNTLTFNPGWDQSAQDVNPFTDVRDIKSKLKDAGMEVTQEQGDDAGPGSFVVVDPDGYPILIDQHR